MADYEISRYSRSRIEKAGKYIASCKNMNIQAMEKEYLEVVDNWRAAHAFPLDEITSEIQSALQSVLQPSEYQNCLIAQRLKRLESIIGKLQRNNNTGLYRMQDLGGCRIIVPTVKDVYNVVNIIKQHLSENGQVINKEYDYLKQPKELSGYRSYHIVIEYHGNQNYDNMLIEIQVRTKLEHYWATAVETIDCIEKDTLKAGTGNPTYNHFFKLASGLFSIKEQTSIVTGIPSSEQEIVEEIYKIENQKSVRETLSAYSQAVRLTGSYKDDAYYYLLVIDRLTKSINVRAYDRENIEHATQKYQELEKTLGQHNGYDVVLVAVQNISSLMDSYPNFFMNAQLFLAKLNGLCSKYPEKPMMDIDFDINSVKVSDLFRITQHGPCTIPSIGDPGAGIGVTDSNVFFCPKFPITLSSSYLRFSGIAIDEQKWLSIPNTESYLVSGPGIIVLRTGACFYVEKENWQYFTESDSIILQPKDTTDSNSLLLLISWLKSNLYTWDLLWNKRYNSAYYDAINKTLYMPILDNSAKETIIKFTRNILDSEYKFVTDSNNNVSQFTQEKIDIFNYSIRNSLQAIETVYDSFYHLSKEEQEKKSLGIKMKGYYSYTE